jgi:hypothetical protein
MSLTRARTSSRSSRNAASSDVVPSRSATRERSPSSSSVSLVRLFGGLRLFGAQLQVTIPKRSFHLVLESIDRVEVSTVRASG